MKRTIVIAVSCMMLGSLSYGMRQAAVPVEVYQVEEAVQVLRRTDDTPEQLEDMRKKVQYLTALGYTAVGYSPHDDPGRLPPFLRG